MAGDSSSRLGLDFGAGRITLLPGSESLWRYEVARSDRSYEIGAPVFEVDGRSVRLSLASIERVGEPVRVWEEAVEHCFGGPALSDPDLRLEAVFRVAEGDPIIRVRYVLSSEGGRKLTKKGGGDELTYLSISVADAPAVTEIRLSEFSELVHSYTLVERTVEERHFEHGLRPIGPILAAEDGTHAALVAYEHGATAPDSFLEYQLSPDRRVALRAAKGNYLDGQAFDSRRPFETVWLQFGAVEGDREDLARAYRAFALHHMSPNVESRKPRIFYNTWNYQERNHHWNGRPYLESMNQERMLQEIEVAHRLGVDVFVIDTGWYAKTGDWEVNTERFPDMGAVKKALDDRGMKLGLWFNPTVAAVSSRVFREHEDCVTSWRGERGKPGRIWETEESHHMCLVSRYAEAFAEELIRLNRELGLTYFKWDAVDQHGCDDPNHDHGGPEHSPQERADSYAFQLGQAMVRIAERVRAACPEAMVDFDVTEAGRYVGLGWLAASRFYLVNNGPYYDNYNLPLPPDQNWNMFFYPGPARAWICRTPLSYDAWIPSVLFMTHYLTDDPGESQLINIGSLILGQNGVWGDLPAISAEGVARFGRLLSLYKQVRDDITEAYPVRSGPIAGTPEVHEKISEKTGRGAVVAFSTRAGKHVYVTRNRVASELWHTPGVQVELDREGRARLEVTFDDRGGAKIVFFGVQE